MKGAFLKDLSVLGIESTDMSRTVLVDNNPLSFICQPTNGILVASFYDDPNDTALASVMQLIRHLDHAGDVRPILKDMFRLDTLLGEYRTALFDDDEDVDCILDDEGEEEEEEELLETCLEEATGDGVVPVTATGGAAGAAGDDSPVGEGQNEAGSNGTQRQDECPLREKEVDDDCMGAGKRGGAKDDDDGESVKTEPCSEGSGDSSLSDESLTTREEMELELEF